MEKIRLLIIDDHPIIGEALLLFLEKHEDIKVVGIARDGEEGLVQLRQLQPDYLIVDLGLPKLGGTEAIHRYLQENPELGITVYTGHNDEHLVYQALQAGARAYVLKGSPISELVSALRKVRLGGYWLSSELNPAIIRGYFKQQGRESEKITEFQRLSTREKQVFSQLARGKSVKEVSEAFCISSKTVSKHKIAIMHKLKVRNAAEMTLYALRHELEGPLNKCSRANGLCPVNLSPPVTTTANFSAIKHLAQGALPWPKTICAD